MSARMGTVVAGLVLACTVGAPLACGGRPAYWNEPASAASSSYGLANGVALVDDAAHRVVVLAARPDQELAARALPVGHHVVSAAASTDGARLFVLSAGDTPRRSAADEQPSLTVIDATTFETKATRFPMAQPLANLAIDPLGRWVAAYSGSGTATSFVQNPNEIVLFDLAAPPGPQNPTSRTIRSFGGQPRRITFTPTLHLPGGARRLLLIETDLDVTLLDLDHAFDSPPRPEITVRLTSGADARQVTPAGLVVDDGDETRTDDARIALRTSDDTNVITLQLAPSAAGAPNDFAPTVNLTEVGGIASDIAFVRTDGGLRVAAIVPSTSSAVLVEPDTSLTTQVKLPSSYARISLVTDVVAAGAGTDVALLWSGSSGYATGVAFWTLGKTVGQPYRSIEVVNVSAPVASVRDVPAPNAHLKVLEVGSGSGFFVLDLKARTASPLSSMTTPTLSIAPDGLRLWAYARGSAQLASVDLASLHPVPLTTDAPIDAIHDVAREGGGRSLIAIHASGTVGATVFDALAPDTASSRRAAALLLEGP